MHATHPKTEQKLQLWLISHINIMPSPIQKVYSEPYSKAHLLIVTTEAHPVHTRQFVPIIIFGCSHVEFDCHAYTHLKVNCCESFSRSRNSKCSPTLLKHRKRTICVSLYAQRYTAVCQVTHVTSSQVHMSYLLSIDEEISQQLTPSIGKPHPCRTVSKEILECQTNTVQFT